MGPFQPGTNPGAGNGRVWRAMHPTASFPPGNGGLLSVLEAEVLCWHRVPRWAFRNEKVLKGNAGADKDLPGRPLPALGKEARGGGTGRLSQL